MKTLIHKTDMSRTLYGMNRGAYVPIWLN